MRRLLIAMAAISLAPVLLWQGIRTRKKTPRLPGAAGENRGEIIGRGVPLKLLVVGESTVAGVGANTHAEAITGQIAYALHARTARPVCWHATGRNGFTARKVCDELLTEIPAQKFDMAVIALGVNDTLQLTAARAWASDLTDLIFALREHTNAAHIFLAGVPPMQHFPALPQPLRFMLGAKSQSLDDAAARLASRLPGVWHIPMEFHGGAEYFCADRFHPSPLGYKFWGEVVATKIVVTLPLIKNEL